MAVTTAQTPRKRPRIKRVKRTMNRFLPRTLLGRSLLIIVSPLVLVQVIATWVFYDRHYDTITKRLAQGIAGDVSAVIRIMGPEPDAKSRAAALDLARRSLWLDIAVRDDARLQADPAPPGWGVLDRKLTKALRERLPYPFVIDTDAPDEMVRIDVQLPVGVLAVRVPRQRLFSSTTYIFIMWMVGSSIVLFGVATIFMRNQVRPIRRLARAADSFGKGRDVPDFRPEGATEVRLAAAAFLQMRSRIKRQIGQRTEMLAGVSHDLRTPLTRMKLQLALLGESPEVGNLASDVAEMEKMVEGYLAFARGEGAEQPLRANLGELLRDIVAQMTREKGGSVDLHVEQTLILPLRPEAMRRCLANLVGNAQGHAEHVMVSAGRRKNIVEVMIDDDGPGIPEAEREDAFKPFHRLDRSRSPDTGGTGLGLAIARDIVRGHGGDIALEDAPGGGLRARLWLPV
ncbi:MAG: ATP-binding protein [Rhodospirillales bacterium]|nr:ATP-binding protein [Rhodospirillales bacterium]MDH3909720.1 ATP-binding protein [Rhodospirillales bacterium]MDH3919457.1 ATP-binding protein [Rhodospirillales bacterium]MDH3966049.1 ATP-binding protein [Rhodospirillales bacterium]